MERLKQQLQAEEIRFAENEPLSAHCTFKIGGPADVFVQPETEEQLCRVIALCKACDVKYYLLGNGSNILFEDAGYRGVVVDTTALKMGIGFLENVSHPGAEPGAVYDAVIAGAGLKLSALCKAALDSSLAHRPGICLWHPRHSGRCSLYECRCLRRRDERRAGLCDVSDQRRRDRDRRCRKPRPLLPAQHL